MIGPHYYMALLIPTVVFAAVALDRLAVRRKSLATLLFVSMIGATMIELPDKIDRNDHFTDAYRAEQAAIDSVVDDGADRHRADHRRTVSYLLHPRGWLTNDLDLRDPILYAADRGADNIELSRRFADRRLYRLQAVEATRSPRHVPAIGPRSGGGQVRRVEPHHQRAGAGRVHQDQCLRADEQRESTDLRDRADRFDRARDGADARRAVSSSPAAPAVPITLGAIDRARDVDRRLRIAHRRAQSTPNIASSTSGRRPTDPTSSASTRKRGASSPTTRTRSASSSPAPTSSSPPSHPFCWRSTRVYTCRTPREADQRLYCGRDPLAMRVRLPVPEPAPLLTVTGWMRWTGLIDGAVLVHDIDGMAHVPHVDLFVAITAPRAERTAVVPPAAVAEPGHGDRRAERAGHERRVIARRHRSPRCRPARFVSCRRRIATTARRS